MATRTLTVVLAGDAKGITGALNKGSSSFAKFGKAAGLAGVAAVAALGAVGVKGVQSAIKLERSLAEVRTLLPEISDEGFGKLRKEVLGFSNEMGIATDKAVPALYQAISAGVPPDNVMTFMETAAKASIGGVTDLEVAVDGISSVINAYGADVVSAQKASDTYFTAVRLGKTTFEELSSSMFNVLPVAAQMGFSFEEATAAVTALTQQGVPTSVATTQIKAAMLSLGAPTKAQAKLMKDLGLDFSQARLEKIGLSGAMLEAVEATNGDTKALRELVGSQEALQAVLALTANDGKNFNAVLDEMGNSLGATDAAAKVMEDTVGFKLDKAMTQMSNLLTEIGADLLPVLADVLQEHVVPAFKSLSAWFNENRDGIRKFFATGAAVVDKFASVLSALSRLVGGDLTGKVIIATAAMTGLLVVIGGVYAAVQVVTVAIKILTVVKKAWTVAATIAKIAAYGLGIAIRVMLGPIGLVITAIGLLIAAGVLLYKNWDTISEIAGKVWSAVWGSVAENWDKILEVLFPMVGLPILIARNWEQIVGFASDIWDRVFTVVKDYIGDIIATVTEFPGQVGEAIAGIPGIFGDVFEGAYHSAIGWIAKGLLLRDLQGFPPSVDDAIKPIPGTFDRIFGEAKSRAFAQMDDLVTHSAASFTSIYGTAVQETNKVAFHWGQVFDNMENRTQMSSQVLAATFKTVGDAWGAAMDEMNARSTSVASSISSAFAKTSAKIAAAIGNLGRVKAAQVGAGIGGMEQITRIAREQGIDINAAAKIVNANIREAAAATLPGLALGGIVPATPGGRLVRVGEGGQDEAIVPLPQGRGMGMRGGDTYILQIDASGGDPERIGEVLFPALQSLRARGLLTAEGGLDG